MSLKIDGEIKGGCQHATRNTVCGKPVIGETTFCHLRTHHPSDEAFEIEYAKLVDQFSYGTHPLPEIKDVPGDGACMFRCLAQALKHSVSKEWLGDDEENAFAYQMQLRLKNWLVEHADTNVPEFGDITVRELVLTGHSEFITDLKMYSELFEIFAGDPDKVKITTPDGKVVTRVLPTRWGGVAEQYAFCKIFGARISVFDIQKLDKKTLKVIPATLRHKDIRLRLIHQFGNEEGVPDVKMVYTVKNGGPHYALLV